MTRLRDNVNVRGGGSQPAARAERAVAERRASRRWARASHSKPDGRADEGKGAAVPGGRGRRGGRRGLLGRDVRPRPPHGGWQCALLPPPAAVLARIMARIEGAADACARAAKRDPRCSNLWHVSGLAGRTAWHSSPTFSTLPERIRRRWPPPLPTVRHSARCNRPTLRRPTT